MRSYEGYSDEDLSALMAEANDGVTQREVREFLRWRSRGGPPPPVEWTIPQRDELERAKPRDPGPTSAIGRRVFGEES
jgi:hypothetical protein